MKQLKTPYYLINEHMLLKNLKIMKYIKEYSGTKLLLALKCFSTWSTFDLISKYMDGVTSSSLYEAKLGYYKFKKENHIFSVAYSDNDIQLLKHISDKIIFNSISQLELFYRTLQKSQIGLRINPGVSYSKFILADPSQKYSKLGVNSTKEVISVLNKISGVMFHYNCENANYQSFSTMLDKISLKYCSILQNVQWVSLGGGVYFTKKGYPLDKFCQKLKDFSNQFKVQIYLEPGEAVVTNSCELITTVLDVVKNIKEIAIVDTSVAAHMPDLLIYRSSAKINNNNLGRYNYIIAGQSCLAGDIFGEYKFETILKPGSIIRFQDTAGYTIVQKNWFNGLKMPSIAIMKLDGNIKIIKKFSYIDFLNSLS
ncbi:MAG: carboxynorspermidine decarboxylase [Endomicrobium sp.]|jgi:carboxynorspermidine decarboxylase|nr:carboxynorspermidine decarboxylase [Endomicrobium sp.]